MKKQTIVEIISALFILLFVYTAMSKLYDPGTFKGSLIQSPLISRYTNTISWLLPTLELFIALLLFIPRTRKIGLYHAFILMILFTLYVAYMIVFASNLPCSCGGILQTMTWRQHLVFNILFALLAVFAILLQRKILRKDLDVRKRQLSYM